MNTKPTVNARALVARLSQAGAELQTREILAPVLAGSRVRTRLNRLVYEFRPRGELVGWGVFRPVNDREVEPIGEALPWQRAAYLELFPTLRVILLWPATDQSNQRSDNRQSQITRRSLNRGFNSFGGKSNVWWALPYNAGDARQRFGLEGTEPLPVMLCDPLNGAERFERVIARVDGKTLWFDGPDLSADPQQAEWLREAVERDEPPTEFPPGLTGSQRLALVYGQIHRLEQADAQELGELARQIYQLDRQEARANLEAQMNWEGDLVLGRRPTRSDRKLEGRLRHALRKADAVLHTYTMTYNWDGTPDQLIVEWSANGQTHRYRSMLAPNLGVVSSGICLSGHDADFDLTSLVNVMAQG